MENTISRVSFLGIHFNSYVKPYRLDVVCHIIVMFQSTGILEALLSQGRESCPVEELWIFLLRLLMFTAWAHRSTYGRLTTLRVEDSE